MQQRIDISEEQGGHGGVKVSGLGEKNQPGTALEYSSSGDEHMASLPEETVVEASNHQPTD